VGLLLAGVILFVMILPTMVAISRDVLAVVPNEQLEGAMALGATRWQVLRKVVVPGARTGLLGAFTLATGRALGETVAVALVIGNSPYIATRSSRRRHDPVVDRQQLRRGHGTELAVLFGAGLVLLVIGIAVNSVARWLVWSTAGRARGRRPMTVLVDLPADPTVERRRAVQAAAASSLRRRKLASTAALGVCWVFLAVAVVPLVAVVAYVVAKGLPAWNADFFTNSTVPRASRGGVWNAIVGTMVITGIAIVVTVPLGLLVGLFLAESEGGWPPRSGSPPTS